MHGAFGIPRLESLVLFDFGIILADGWDFLGIQMCSLLETAAMIAEGGLVRNVKHK